MAIIDQAADGFAAPARADAAAEDNSGERASWFQVAPLVAGAAAVLRPADAGGAGGQLLRLQPHRDHPGLHLRQLHRAVPLGGDAPALCQLAQVRADRLGRDLGAGLQHCLLPGLPRARPVVPDRPVPALHGAVPDLEHHPHDLVDPVPRPQRHLQPGPAGRRRHQPAAGVPAVLRLRRHRGLRAPVHAVHGGADLQLHGAHRQKPARGGARRRRRPFPRGRRGRAGRCRAPASRWARSSSSPW